MEKVLF